jgi:hypothetical protein
MAVHPFHAVMEILTEAVVLEHCKRVEMRNVIKRFFKV